VRFTIVGKDNGNVHEKAFRSKLDDKYNERIKFFGYVSREELMRFYRDCNIFVAPSLSESFGLIFAEAMSWGKPVVACNVCAVGEVIEDGKSGILVPPEDGGAIAKALIKLVQEKAMCESFGMRGRELCEQNYSLDIMAKNMVKFYRQSIDRKTHK
ncbi:MAG: glycosyltransferase family 4 protein, partial [Candidatus Heimdallarchaeota archaeon]|nr:glycosyltransferase family 4 protein [Candidatus Heimdallarchaeota archaeon]